jgi:hypothetical protein
MISSEEGTCFVMVFRKAKAKLSVPASTAISA